MIQEHEYKMSRVTHDTHNDASQSQQNDNKNNWEVNIRLGHGMIVCTIYPYMKKSFAYECFNDIV